MRTSQEHVPINLSLSGRLIRHVAWIGMVGASNDGPEAIEKGNAMSMSGLRVAHGTKVRIDEIKGSLAEEEHRYNTCLRQR